MCCFLSNKKNKRDNCKNPLLSRKDKNKLIALIGSLDVCDEDSVFDIGVELEHWSIKLRSLVLSRSSDD